MTANPNRVRLIVILGVVAVVAFLLLDSLVVTPLTDVFDALHTEQQRLEARLTEAEALIQNQRRIRGRWAAYEAAGLDFDADSARIRAQEQLNAWSRAAGLNVERLSSERVKTGERFDEIGFIVTGSGSMASVQRFLFSLRQAPFALRVTTCDLTSRDERQDQLTLSLRLSTLVSADAPAEQLAGQGGAP